MSVLKKPLITEKQTAATDKLGRVGFVVDRHATKGQIKAEIEKMYGVEVASINTMVMAPKTKSKYSKTAGFVNGRTPIYKKAIVTLKSGQIDFFENI
ncbi:MAG: 50S ribosomal protein L23 [Bacteroidota bacterium]|nr:50S ribosomal protein L23 [Bacteroidota bacterium]MDX5430566.1 50S ribosomal protein L23 [Bacteroidota bacterium]MDX5469318.1 50S ribosomal protein L23 [Bacteroidota bacterium]